ncbi:T-cell immunomodulatory protein-like [Lingula anatina]|uniref:T-cell immunomodulatory protein-like n=1 Tax=Lingula anatina TaxID=7574 RepID=A0A1S3H2U0_LINAN|nr:T-cell immunomodulatory protein-like [Lingula anatina]|eukprot:XP_013380262.1 T-cell immunomodulatory protein-like [Lingula anatina]
MSVKNIFTAFYLLNSLLCGCSCNAQFTDITDEVFGKSKDGILAAFGDFNADKQTDIFLISPTGKNVDILLAVANKQYVRVAGVVTIADTTGNISSVVPGDYDGDLYMDILVTIMDNTGLYTVEVHYGYYMDLDRNSLQIVAVSNLTEKLQDEPLVLDMNGDFIPDLFGVNQRGQRQYWVAASNKRNFTSVNITTPAGLSAIRNPHSNAFIDLNYDLSADLFVTTSNGSFEYWLNKDGELTYTRTVRAGAFSGSQMLIGQSVFGDFGGRGEMEHLVPVCSDSNCGNSQIFVLTDEKWIKLPVSFKDNNGVIWGFKPPTKNSYNNIKLPVSLRVGDYDHDGFPDLLAILYSSGRESEVLQSRVFLLNNIPCTSEECQALGRTFQVQWTLGLGDVNSPLVAAFFDIYQEGHLDIIVSSQTTSGVRLYALKNGLDLDACFIKVMVLTGQCYGNCTNGGKASYGVNQPGPTIEYYSTRPDGTPERGLGEGV